MTKYEYEYYLGSKIGPNTNTNFATFDLSDGMITSIPCGRIECITASMPTALIVPFNSDLEIYPFVTSHAV